MIELSQLLENITTVRILEKITTVIFSDSPKQNKVVISLWLGKTLYPVSMYSMHLNLWIYLDRWGNFS